MKRVHFVLQGKGGVGKTFVASLLAQYHQEQDREVICIDTDPVNATFSGYKAFNVQRLELMDGNELNPRKFDQMMTLLIEQDSHFIIDNGAASFLPLSNYLLENDVINLLSDNSKEVYIHTLISGSQGLRDTLTGFSKLAEHLPEKANLIVWLNDYFGPIVSEDGKTFEEMKVYTKHKGRISGLIRIPRQTSSTFGQDVEMMLAHRATFAEVKENPIFELMAKQRLTMVKRNLFEQMDAVAV
ncbi:ArsA-related P-loop ATPase [Vampirovibrio sp.]|uniref:nucleotide-binding protein n=1 Tax=Vampirovibrio sp. TaxID=2717857 RepID=UPI003593F979